MIDWYIIKTVIANTETFKTVLVFMTSDEDGFTGISSKNLYGAPLSWIRDLEDLSDDLVNYDGNCNQLIIDLFNDFKKEYEEEIEILMSVTTNKKLEEMLYIIEMFIADTVINHKNKMELSAR